jgi:succinoglycan biosynthesis protein ExoA
METEEFADVTVEEKPLVSIILATYNEAGAIENCLDSILRQRTSSPFIGEFEIEVLAVDGLSSDGTRAILERYAGSDPRLRVVNNPRRRAAFAFNLGLRHAHGQYVCLFGAHTVYCGDYIAVCLDELIAHNAAACGGRVRTVPAGQSLSARLAAWTMSHPFGSSRKSFRTQAEGSVETVNYAIFRRDLALAAGGYDEDLLRNQENDLNQKLRAAGYVLWCTWKTQCLYFPKGTTRGLFRYAYGNGYWSVLSLAKNPAAMGARHFIPLLFVVCLALAAFIGAAGALAPVPDAWMALAPVALLLALHLGLGAVASAQVALRERSPGALLLPFAFLGFHIAYGFGTLRGLVDQPWSAWLPKQRPRRGSVPLGD